MREMIYSLFRRTNHLSSCGTNDIIMKWLFLQLHKVSIGWLGFIPGGYITPLILSLCVSGAACAHRWGGESVSDDSSWCNGGDSESDLLISPGCFYGQEDAGGRLVLDWCLWSVNCCKHPLQYSLNLSYIMTPFLWNSQRYNVFRMSVLRMSVRSSVTRHISRGNFLKCVANVQFDSRVNGDLMF